MVTPAHLQVLDVKLPGQVHQNIKEKAAENTDDIMVEVMVKNRESQPS